MADGIRAAQAGPGADIVCLSTNHWTGLPTSKQCLMREMARATRVLYVEPPLDVFSVLGRRRRWSKLRGLRRELPGLWVLSPVAGSVPSRPGRRAAAWGRLVPRIREAIERLGFEERALWCFSPEQVDCVGRLGERSVVYSAADEPTAFSRDPQATQALEERMLDAADLVLVVSASLLEGRARHPNIHRLPNAADAAHFSRVLAGEASAGASRLLDAVEQAADGPGVPDGLRRLRRPVILYGGAAYGWLDHDLLGEVARGRPEWTLALVGPGGASETLPSNVVRLGRRPYGEFPWYVASCDVAMLPWKEGVFSRNADPIVLYQYLLCGKPVVATPFPAARERGALIATAVDAAGFAQAVERALAEPPDDPVRRLRVEFALANTWEDRAREAALHIRQLAGDGGGGR